MEKANTCPEEVAARRASSDLNRPLRILKADIRSCGAASYNPRAVARVIISDDHGRATDVCSGECGVQAALHAIAQIFGIKIQVLSIRARLVASSEVRAEMDVFVDERPSRGSACAEDLLEACMRAFLDALRVSCP